MLTSLKELLDVTMRSLGGERRAKALRAVDLWPEVAGERWARHSVALDVRRGRLYVATPNSVVSQELSLRRAQMIAALNARLGGAVINEIVFVARPDVVPGGAPAEAAPAGREAGDPEVEREARAAIDQYLKRRR